MQVHIVGVAVPAPLFQLLDYLCVEPLPTPGCRVLVELGRRRVVGVVLRVEATPTTSPFARLKPILQVLDPISLLDPVLLQLTAFAAEYYHHPPGEVLAVALPQRLRRAEPFAPPLELAYALSESGRQALQAGTPGLRQSEVLKLLTSSALPRAQLLATLPQARAVLPGLRRRQWIDTLELPRRTLPARAAVLPPLHPEQQVANAHICAALGRFQPFLLEGVTGSGKTEVYLAAVAAAVREGRQALLLVPEIGLTPQFIARLRDRLAVRLGVLHSGLVEATRAATWLEAAAGHLDVVVGTRSAVYTPLPALGLIVVDEEHDGSYKQAEGLRYSARDLALKRGQLAQVPVVLGSATPSLESLRQAESGRYRHLRLNQRHGAAVLPALERVDVRQRPTFEGLSDLALQAIAATLARGEQVLVFRNQRGYAPVMICHDCGWHPHCDACARPLTWHRADARLRCHHCGWHTPQPPACPACGSLELRGQGVGTERLESVLGKRFPHVPLIRLDRDSTARRGSLEAALAQIQQGGPLLVVGTQMLVKGHDWPGVTCVVIVDVDGALFSMDFRAGERLAQQIVQVAGRAGRAHAPGKVLLQTHQVDHPLLLALVRGGYRAAIAHEQSEREAAGFPPFGALALLRCEARSLQEALDFLAKAAALVRPGAGVTCSAPMPAPMMQRAGQFRTQLWLQATRRAVLQQDLRLRMPLLQALRCPAGLRWSLDVDPQDTA